MKTGITALSIALFAGSAIAADQDITAIFGSGNADTNWTATQGNGIEIGLRAKLRFNDSNSPENTFNSDNNGTYTFGTHTTTRSQFNYEWSINTNTDGSGRNLFDSSAENDYEYRISVDYNPGVGVTDF
jgi:hypothetical protein